MENTKKIYITDDDVNKFLELSLPKINKIKRDFDLCAFYRGGLPMGTKVSNILDKNLYAIFLQTRDKQKEPTCFMSHRIENDTLVVIEDIIDSGETIFKFFNEIINRYPEVKNIHIFTLVANSSILPEIIKRGDILKINTTIDYYYELSDKSWYVFPWENIKDESNSENKEYDNYLIKGIAETFSSCLETVKKKNSDYNAGNDPLDNFFNVEKLNITTAEKGILVRLSDKFSRITSLLNKGSREVKDESIIDTIDDAINYFAILKEIIKKKKKF